MHATELGDRDVTSTTKDELNATNHSRRDGLYFLIVGAVIYLLGGLVFIQKLPFAMTDFKVVYFSARCLTRHCDPYSVDNMRQLFHDNAQFNVAGHPGVQVVIERFFYPPTIFPITAPLALLPFLFAKLVWIIIGTTSYLAAAYLMWRAGAPRSPLLAGILSGFLVANSIWLFMIGNSAMLSIGLCIVAV